MSYIKTARFVNDKIMAEFKFFCPRCGRQIQCDTGYAGTQINCPACQQAIAVPQAEGAAVGPTNGLERQTLKNILVVAVALAVLAGLVIGVWHGSSETGKRPVLIEPNAGVDKVQKGMNKDQVEAAIGRPEKINDRWWVYQHRGMIVAFDDNGVMFNIKCTSPFAGVTKEGIGIGSTRAELLAAYGNPSQEKHFQGADNRTVVYGGAGYGGGGTFDDWWFASLGINFDLQNDKVTSFIVHLNAR